MTSYELKHRTDSGIWQSCYLLFIVAVGFVLLMTLSGGTEISLALRLLLVALLLLTLKRWTGAVLLGFSQLQLLLLEPRIAHQEMSSLGLLWMVQAIALLVFVSRYRTLQENDSQPGYKSLYHLTTLVSQGTPPAGLQHNFREVIRQTVRTCFMLTACGIVAWIIMTVFPVVVAGFSTIREYRLRPSGYRLLMLGLTLFAVFLVTWLVVSEFAWRRVSRRQASVYLRSLFLSYLHHDLRMVVRRRIKKNRKIARALQPVHRDSFSADTIGE